MWNHARLVTSVCKHAGSRPISWSCQTGMSRSATLVWCRYVHAQPSTLPFSDSSDFLLWLSLVLMYNCELCPTCRYTCTTQALTLFYIVISAFFWKSNYLFFGYSDPINIYFNDKNKQLLGWTTRCFGKNSNTEHDVFYSPPRCVCYNIEDVKERLCGGAERQSILRERWHP